MGKKDPVKIDLTQATPLTEEQRKNAQPFDSITNDSAPPINPDLESSPEWKIIHAQRTEMSDLLNFPNSSIGKLYSVVYENAETRAITIEKGTAFVVGKNVLMTAAHCIYGTVTLTETNDEPWGYYKRFEYYPAYPFATNPIRIKQAWVNEQYIEHIKNHPGDNDARIPYDYGFLITEDPIPGIVLNLDISAPAYDKVKSIGYPDQYPFKGLQYFCEGDTHIEVEKQKIRMSSNDMVPGCSGGPWIHNNTVVGINSTREHIKGMSNNGAGVYNFFSPIITQKVIDIAESFSIDQDIQLADASC